MAKYHYGKDKDARRLVECMDALVAAIHTRARLTHLNHYISTSSERMILPDRNSGGVIDVEFEIKPGLIHERRFTMYLFPSALTLVAAISRYSKLEQAAITPTQLHFSPQVVHYYSTHVRYSAYQYQPHLDTLAERVMFMMHMAQPQFSIHGWEYMQVGVIRREGDDPVDDPAFRLTADNGGLPYVRRAF